MNTRRLMTALCFALLCSALLTWQLSRHLSASPAPSRAVPSRALVVAAKNLPAGESISASSLAVVKWPATEQITESFKSADELIGRVLLVPISSGELILAHDLAVPGFDNSPDAAVPPGMRAISVHTNDASTSISGLLTSGSHVDVLVSYRSDTEAAFVSSMVLQNARVLTVPAQKGATGVDTRARSDDSITLLVSPEEAARLTAASSLGKLTFAVRNGTDNALNPGLSHVGLFPTEIASRQTAPPSPARSGFSGKGISRTAFTMEMLSGGKSTIQTFQGEQP